LAERAPYPTPYPGVNEALDALLAGARTVLDDQFVGLYLHGSLAVGSFSPGRSDIDFCVVAAEALPEDTIQVLERLHGRLMRSGLEWADRLEGPFISQRALCRYDPDHAQHPSFRTGGTFGVDGYGIDWVIQSYTLREQGIALSGPAIETLIDPILPEDLRRASAGVLREWWAPMLDDTMRLQSAEYQAYAVLTMCRIGYTLHFGRVAPKPVAARWAQDAYDARWADLIHEALAWEHGQALARVDEVLDLIRDTLRRCQDVEL
jgi:hypothetical protein